MSEKQSKTSILLHQNLEFSSKTDVGEKRTENQDRYGQVIKDNFKVFIVADGMGGANGGSTASQMTIDHLTEQFAKLENVVPEDIYRILMEANEKIFNHSIDQRHLAGMGTTCVMLIFTAKELYITNVGDSRAYLVRNKEIRQLTEDHTLVNELFKAGIITAEQAEDHPVSHMLTRCLGPAVKVEIDCYLEKPGSFRGDSYLLCSDGLYNLVTDSEIKKIISNNTPEAAASKLISVANERGGTDNITVFIVNVKDSPFDPQKDAIHYDLVPISFKDMPGYIEEESFERVLLRHSAAFDRYGIDFQQEKTAKNNWRNVSFILAILAVVASLIYFLDDDLSVIEKITSVKKTEEAIIEQKHSETVSKLAELKEFRDDSEPVIDQDRLQVIANKYLSSLAVESDYLTLLQKDQELEDKFDSLNSQLSTKKAELIGLNKQLSFWFGLRKKLELNGAMSLSEELSSLSEQILEKQTAFQEASWEYLQNLNLMQSQPENQALAQKVKSQLNQRKNAMKELEISVYSMIQEKVNYYSTEIADLINEISTESLELNYLISEIDLLALLRGLDYQTQYEQIKKIILTKMSESAPSELTEDTLSDFSKEPINESPDPVIAPDTMDEF